MSGLRAGQFHAGCLPVPLEGQSDEGRFDQFPDLVGRRYMPVPAIEDMGDIVFRFKGDTEVRIVSVGRIVIVFGQLRVTAFAPEVVLPVVIREPGLDFPQE